ncbi:MAG: hypothetical protein Q7S29_05770 [Candidatus Peribacter sp.]|nr:hypothetical protein [Candidatus Peribacter sp.]
MESIAEPPRLVAKDISRPAEHGRESPALPSAFGAPGMGVGLSLQKIHDASAHAVGFASPQAPTQLAVRLQFSHDTELFRLLHHVINSIE